MTQIFHYFQKIVETKFDKDSECNIEVFFDENILTLKASFVYNFHKYNDAIQHVLDEIIILDMTSGDITLSYHSKLNNLSNPKKTKDEKKSGINNFGLLRLLCSKGFYRGERYNNFWGRKYKNSFKNLKAKVLEILLPEIKSEFIRSKIVLTSTEDENNSLYNILSLFFIDKKDIKGNDHILQHIQEYLPKKKWLKKNDNKFIPAVLESLGIKSKYLIKHLNIEGSGDIRISTLNYFCKLFGDNYLQYLKQIPWQKESAYYLSFRKIHRLKDEREKRSLANIMNEWWEMENTDPVPLSNILQEMFSIREFVESCGLPLTFNPKNVFEFYILLEHWKSLKAHYKRGYKLKFSFDESFIKDIEEPIIVNNEVFLPKILITEEDFNIEGTIMGNCMAQQFKFGGFNIYVSLSHGKKRINAQYKNGELIQHFGKANTTIMDYFYPALNILTERVSKYSNLKWEKIKYDIR